MHKHKRGMKIFIVVIIAILVLNLAGAISIDKRINENLKDNKEVRVIVKLKDAQEPLNFTLNEKRILVKQSQSKVLDVLNKEDFKLNYKYETVNGFSGKITKQGLEKLKNNPYVEAIQYDSRVSISLDVSVPNINATKIWPVKINGTNLTGKSQTICIIDTGIDYTHPSLGNCSIARFAFNGTIENLSTPIESHHNYLNNYLYNWTITMPGYSNIAIHFRNMSIESNFDQLKLYDKNGKEFASYSGNHDDMWSASTPGDTINIIWKTDDNINDYGIYIDKVLNGTTNMTFDWSNCSKVIGGWDFYNSDGDPIDDNNHGTHVAGIVVSTDAIYKGVAPESNLIAIKVLSSSGSGTDSDVAAGIDWCINRSEDYNISVISMSLGCEGNCTRWQTPCDGNEEVYFTSAPINLANSLGIAVVVAAGNNGWTNGITSPACVSGAIPVGAVNDSDAIIYNRGNLLKLLAPGVKIRSTILGGGFSDSSGTSMATPHVSGAIAIMKQYLNLKGKAKTPKEIESAFNLNGKIVYDSSSGLNYSRIDVYNTVKNIVIPEIIINSPKNTTYRNRNILVNISSDGENIWFFNGTANISYISADYYNFSEGNNSIHAYANDSFGNINSTSVLFSIDSIPPAIELISPDDSYSTLSRSIIFSYKVSDASNIANCSLILNNAISQEAIDITKDTVIGFSSMLSAGTYNWQINCTDSAGNQANSSSRTLIITSSGGGGGGSSASREKTYSITGEQAINSFTESLARGDKIKFSLAYNGKSENHTLTLNKLNATSATFVIQSDKINVVLKVGEEKNITLSEDYILYLKLNSILNNKASVTLKAIRELAAENVSSEEQTAEPIIETKVEIKQEIRGEREEKTTEKIKSFPKNKLIYATTVILIIIALIVYFLKVKKDLRRLKTNKEYENRKKRRH